MTKIGVKDESSIPGGRIRLKLSHVNLDCHEENTGYTPLIIAVLNGKFSQYSKWAVPCKNMSLGICGE